MVAASRTFNPAGTIFDVGKLASLPIESIYLKNDCGV
jgi:hypothetical protein